MKTTKIIIIATIITIAVIALCGAATATAEDGYFPLLTAVVGTEKVGDLYLITCKDKQGDLWSFFDEEEEAWHEGDLCNLLMKNTGDAEEDAEVVEAYHEGHLFFVGQS